jgi:anti-sigma regulatory factor (Ser/Thr protein kinase)
LAASCASRSDEHTEWFEATFEAPAAGRRFAIDVLEHSRHTSHTVCDAVQLVVSELATNAVIHARTAFSISVRCQPSAIRLAVRDRSQVPPMLRAARPDQASGRGLGLVAAVAVDWGVDPAPDGKTVWAQLSA